VTQDFTACGRGRSSTHLPRRSCREKSPREAKLTRPGRGQRWRLIPALAREEPEIKLIPLIGDLLIVVPTSSRPPASRR
jgi:hypothetical protein